MSQNTQQVKGLIARFVGLIDNHPRTMAYIAIITSLNFLVTLTGLLR